MKPMLQRDRASSAVPARSSFAARFGAWAKESLVARGLAVAVGLSVLAMIGGSALAGGTGAKPGSPSEAPVSSASLTGAPLELSSDAGAAPFVRPEAIPRGASERAAPVIELDDPGNPGEAETAAPTTRGAGAKNVARATPDDPVDLNTARVDDLRRLPGVGAKRAQAILALRAHLPGGRFRQLEDLLKVKGVGRAMIKRIHPLVRLSGAETAPR
jgi:competence protein ComEA